MREGLGRTGRQASRVPLHPLEVQGLAQVQVQQRAGVHRDRVDRAARVALGLGGAARRVSRGRRAAVRREGRHRLRRAGADEAQREAPPAGTIDVAARRNEGDRGERGPLGAPAARGAGRVRGVDTGRQAPTSSVPRHARRQVARADRPGARMTKAVKITNPDKLLWRALEITKQRYVDYLAAVGERMLPWLRDRPLSLVRAPDGVAGERYYQKDTPKYAPSWIKTVTIPAVRRDVSYTVCNDAATLAWLGNQAALEFPPAPVRRDKVDQPDTLTVDIDPPDDAFDAAVEVALLVLEVTDDLGLRTLVKTTGGKGLHIVAPIQRRVTADGLRHAANRLTEIVQERRPDLVTAEFRKADRGGKVMLDPSRNSTGATVVAPYSPRARDEATVSFPVVPGELKKTDPSAFTVATVPKLLDRKGPKAWSEAERESPQRIPRALLPLE